MTSCEMLLVVAVWTWIADAYVVHQLRVLPLRLLMSEHWLPEYPEIPHKSWYRV